MKTTLTSLFLCIAALVFGQNIIMVDNNPSAAADYSNLQDAINASEPGDFIYVIPSGTSYGSVSVSSEVNLRGMGHLPIGSNGVPSELSTLTFNNGCGNSTVSGFRIINNISGFTNTAGFNDNVVISNCIMTYMTVGGNNWTIEGNVINCSQPNVYGIGSNGWSNTTIHHNIIRYISDLSSFAALHDFDNTTLEFNNIYILDTGRLTSQAQSLQFTNSVILTLTEADGLVNFSSSSLSFQNCLTYNYNGFSIAGLPGENNLFDSDPEFTNLQGGSPLFSYSNNYFPADGSPLLDAATDGDNIGVYNDTYNFDQRGHAADLPYLTNMTVLTPGVTQGGNLEVEFSAFGN